MGEREHCDGSGADDAQSKEPRTRFKAGDWICDTGAVGGCLAEWGNVVIVVVVGWVGKSEVRTRDVELRRYAGRTARSEQHWKQRGRDRLAMSPMYGLGVGQNGDVAGVQIGFLEAKRKQTAHATARV